MSFLLSLVLPQMASATSANSQLVPRQSGLFIDNTAYDRIAEFILVLTLGADLLTLVGTTKRNNRFFSIALFFGVNTYYFIVMLIHLHVFSASANHALGVLASLFWWIFATLIAYFEFVQFVAIMKAVKPGQRILAEVPRVVVTLGMFISGVLVFLAYLSAYVDMPAIFDDLTLGNLIQCSVCIPRLLSTLWILYVVRDIAKVADGVVRKLGRGYVRISGIQILNSIVGLIMLNATLSSDGRFVSLIGSVVEILIHYAICAMLAAELNEESTKGHGSATVKSKNGMSSLHKGKD
ncbi:hypothetical protein HDV06_003662 [Boothiomyces sp. JEL0866]|nr:hypothetical protein HDV06_003662 [Boothiomyces sp. JEL0866]